MDRKYIMCALGYAIIGMLLGMHMAATKNHGQMVAHAHIMLAGFVVSFIYGLCHKLWLNNVQSTLATVQFYLHQIGVAILSLGLFLLYGNFVSLELLDPILGLSSFAVLLAMILMKVMFIKSGKST